MLRIRVRVPLAVVLAAAVGACADAGVGEEAPAVPSVVDDDGLLEGDEDQNANDPTGASASGARKGTPGAANGDGDFCDNGTCVATEGDCDSSAQCSDGSVCLTDNGGRYADLTGVRRNQQDDHCAPATCNNRGLDPGEAGVDCGGACGLCAPVCELADGHADRCTYHCQCASTGGDCDANDACVGWDLPDPNLRAVCVADVGNRFGFVATNDHCLPAHCRNRTQDFGESGVDVGGPCGVPNCANPVPGNECTPSCPCGAGGGDCDTNLDCLAGLTCVERGITDRCEPPLVNNPTVQDFDNPGTPFTFVQFGTAPNGSVLPGGPTGNFARIVTNVGAQSNGLYLDQTSNIAASQVVVDFDFRIGGGGRADGIGFALMRVPPFPATGGAGLPYFSEEANVAQSVGIGFDTYNNGEVLGNNHLSLHFSGSLLGNFAPGFDIRTNLFHHARITLNLAAGTVSVQLTQNGGLVTNPLVNVAVPGLAPYAGRLAFTARTGGLNDNHEVDNISAVYTP